MSAPVQHEDSVNDPWLYAPPWARERPLPVAGEPQSISSPPVASALDEIPPSPPAAPPSRLPRSTFAPRMPKDGPNVGCPPGYRPEPEFSGDIAMRVWSRRLALEPDIVPQPPILLGRDSSFPWITATGLILLATGIAAFGIAFVATSELGGSGRVQVDRTVLASANGPPTPATPVREPARLVIEDGKVSVNEPLPLGVSLIGASGGEFILIGGLAAGTRLTAGTPIGGTSWRVMAHDLGSIMAYAPRDHVGAMEAAIDLRSAGDKLLDSQIVRLEWLPKAPEAASRDAAVVRPTLQPLAPDEIATLIQRGEQYLRSGDISSARLVFQRAAQGDSAAAALGLGATFDPLVLQQIGVLGFAPNVSQARQWYERAAELGLAEATQRIERLRGMQR